MMEEKDLLRITRRDGSLSIEMNCKVDKEAQYLALALYSIMRSRPDILENLSSLMMVSTLNPEFDKLVDNAKVQMPDFNKILKQN